VSNKNTIFKIELINNNAAFSFKGDYETFIKTYAKSPITYIMTQTIDYSREQHKKLLKEIQNLSEEDRELKKLEFITKHYQFSHVEIVSVKVFKRVKAEFMNEVFFDKFLFV
jgi:uncharacterized protein YllA (UPF0747 family)